jgi:hypothetical protein
MPELHLSVPSKMVLYRSTVVLEQIELLLLQAVQMKQLNVTPLSRFLLAAAA